jgi:hypothetical protein
MAIASTEIAAVKLTNVNREILLLAIIGLSFLIFAQEYAGKITCGCPQQLIIITT